MPNLKIYVDASQGPETLVAAHAALEPLRQTLCRELQVDFTACQFAVLPVHGLADQPQVNCEILILPRPERSRQRITEICGLIRAELSAATGRHVAVRSSLLDAETYIALK